MTGRRVITQRCRHEGVVVDEAATLPELAARQLHAITWQEWLRLQEPRLDIEEAYRPWLALDVSGDGVIVMVPGWDVVCG